MSLTIVIFAAICPHFNELSPIFTNHIPPPTRARSKDKDNYHIVPEKAVLPFNILATAKFYDTRPSLDHSAAGKKLIHKKPTVKSDLGKLVEIQPKVGNTDIQIIRKTYLDQCVAHSLKQPALKFILFQMAKMKINLR